MAAERLRVERVNERRRILELDLQQARYEASLAERRYAACDPDNRLIAAQLEKSWETALRQVEACQARLEPAAHDMMQSAGAADFLRLAKDLETAWTSPNVSMRSRQQLLRALVVDIIADVDEAARDVILTTADPLLNRVDGGDAFDDLFGVWRVRRLVDVDEVSSRVNETKRPADFPRGLLVARQRGIRDVVRPARPLDRRARQVASSSPGDVPFYARRRGRRRRRRAGLDDARGMGLPAPRRRSGRLQPRH
jgi:hypothetical protein